MENEFGDVCELMGEFGDGMVILICIVCYRGSKIRRGKGSDWRIRP